jgi:hypothetical protein
MRATGLQPRQDRCRDSSELLRAIPKFGRASRPRGCPRSPRSRSTTDSTKAQCVVGFVLRDFRPTTQLFPKARTQPSQIWSRSSRMGSGQSSRALKVDPLRASSRRQGKQLGPRLFSDCGGYRGGARATDPGFPARRTPPKTHQFSFVYKK